MDFNGCDVVYGDINSDVYMYIARIGAEAFKYIGNLGRERYDASYRASAVAASKPISAALL